jgi:hypothetical protein
MSEPMAICVSILASGAPRQKCLPRQNHIAVRRERQIAQGSLCVPANGQNGGVPSLPSFDRIQDSVEILCNAPSMTTVMHNDTVLNLRGTLKSDADPIVDEKHLQVSRCQWSQARRRHTVGGVQ